MLLFRLLKSRLLEGQVGFDGFRILVNESDDPARLLQGADSRPALQKLFGGLAVAVRFDDREEADSRAWDVVAGPIAKFNKFVVWQIGYGAALVQG